jgi:ATP-dependent protease ClpP protease subunit
MEKEEKIWSGWMAEFSNKDSDFWYKKAKKDFYFTADEALELGLVDEVF